MAVVDVWISHVKMGKAPEVLQWLKKNLEYHVSHGANDGRILSPISGDTSVIVSELEYDSLDAMQEHIRKFYQSDEWKNVLSKAKLSEWLVDGGNARYQYNIIK